MKPCPPDALLEAVRAVPIPVPTIQDLLIVARERVGIHDVLERFGAGPANVEIRLDRRRGERREGARRAAASVGVRERRRVDRRAFDVNEQLVGDGWAFIPATHRS